MRYVTLSIRHTTLPCWKAGASFRTHPAVAFPPLHSSSTRPPHRPRPSRGLQLVPITIPCRPSARHRLPSAITTILRRSNASNYSVNSIYTSKSGNSLREMRRKWGRRGRRRRKRGCREKSPLSPRHPRTRRPRGAREEWAGTGTFGSPQFRVAPGRERPSGSILRSPAFNGTLTTPMLWQREWCIIPGWVTRRRMRKRKGGRSTGSPPPG